MRTSRECSNLKRMRKTLLGECIPKAKFQAGGWNPVIQGFLFRTRRKQTKESMCDKEPTKSRTILIIRRHILVNVLQPKVTLSFQA